MHVIHLCTGMSCGYAERGSGVLVMQDEGQLYGDAIQFRCEYGYELFQGDLIRTCQQNKRWSGSMPFCTRM